MKKLLLYLVAIITLGTMSVDALAATKPMYIEKPSDMTSLHFWWWGGSQTASSLGFDFNGNNGKKAPDLFASATREKITVTEVKGSDEKDYFKVEIDEATTGIKINQEADITSDIWDKVYSYNSSSTGAKYTKGSAVSDIITTTPPPTPSSKKVWIGGHDFGWGAECQKDANLFNHLGNEIYEKTVTVSGGNYFSIYFAKETEVQQYNIATDREKLELPIKNVVLAQNSNGMKFKGSSDVEVKITLDLSDISNPKISMVDPNASGDTYSWFPIVNGAKAEWTNSSNRTYTAAALNSFAVGLYKNNETTPTKTYGLNSTTVSASDNYTFKAGETAVSVNKDNYKDFTFTVTPGDGTAPDIDNVAVAVTSSLKDHFTWKPFVGKENATEAVWTNESNGTYTFTAESLDGFSIKLYNNGNEVATYGHTGNSMGATEANHTLHKGNNPVAINNTDYQDFTFTFTPGEITSIPSEIKVNLTSTNKGDVVTGRAIYLGGTEGFANVNGVDLKGGWSNYANDANKLTDNGDGTYSKEVSLVNGKEFAVFIDGKSYSPGSGSDRFWLNSYVSKWDLSERATDVSMLIKSDFAKAIVTVWFEDGNPKMSVIDPDAVPVTVYFVNRGGWEEPIRCFNWTDADGDNNFKFNNGKDFNSRENMTKLEGNDELKKQILGANYDLTDWKDHIWTFTLNNKYKEDGTLLRPKVIFSAKDGNNVDVNQSRNLFVVANGIYTNSAGQAESDVKASELLPARIINEEGDVEVYPNTFHNTEYATIYTSDPKFLAWAKGWTAGNMQRVAVQLTYEKDGEAFTCTGDPGTTHMVKTVINGKEFLRLDMAKDVIPDQTRLKELIIWELSGTGTYGSIKLNSDGSIDVTQDGDGDKISHKLGNDNSGKEYTENGTNPELDGKHHSDSSDHHKCFFSDCPLVFTNVYFRNGFVYNRDGIHSILEEVKPDALYIVSRGTGEHDFTLAGYPGRKLTINGEEKQAYRINATELLGRPQYVIPDVPYQAYFSFVGLFNNYTEDNGDITPEKQILYAFPFEGENTYTNDKKLFPGKPEAISADDKGFYSIDRNGKDYPKYDVTVDWLTPSVSIAPAKQDAEFVLAIPNAETGILEPRQNGFLYMYAMADSEYPFKEEDGSVTNVIDYDAQPVAEPDELRSRLCVVQYNEDITDETFFDNVTVSMTRTNDYERYFRNNTANKPAYVKSTVEGEGYVRSGKALHAHKDHAGVADLDTKHRHVYLRAHTAGVAIVRITQDKAVTLGTDDESKLTFNPTEYSFPVRILPTPSSIGLELNGHGIYAVNYKGGVDLDPMTGEAPEYEFGVTNNKYSDDKTPNQIWTRDCIKMEPNGCAYEVEDNDGQKIKTVKIYWDYEKPAEASKARRSVVEAQSSALTAYDVYYPIAFTEKQRFSRTHAISETELKKRLAENPETGNNVYMQIVHNGVVSPVYTVKVNAGENVPTDVNEVEVAEEVEPVYYNLNGVRVNGENLAKGIYVKVTGNRTEKIFVK